MTAYSENESYWHLKDIKKLIIRDVSIKSTKSVYNRADERKFVHKINSFIRPSICIDFSINIQ
jgi:hypothetical protein